VYAKGAKESKQSMDSLKEGKATSMLGKGETKKVTIRIGYPRRGLGR